MTDVTVVVSTYNRPRALVSALEGVKWQTLAPKTVLIIGDCCSPETGEALQQVSGLPFHYINLNSRFGEQAGPNSIGVALAKTRYVAFLNHDDLWLPDHLERTIATLEKRRADFVTGRAAFAHADTSNDDRAIFTEVSPNGRKLADAFAAPFYLFEPMSAWVMTTKAARRMKHWRSAATIYRPPLADWILRASRAGLRHQDSAEITVLKHGVYALKDRREKLLYDISCATLDAWITSVASQGVGAFRNYIAQDLENAKARGLGRNFTKIDGPPLLVEEAARVLTPLNAAFFRWTGWDAMDVAYQRAGLERGWRLRQALQRRTGEPLPTPPDLATVSRWAAAQLAKIDQA